MGETQEDQVVDGGSPQASPPEQVAVDPAELQELKSNMGRVKSEAEARAKAEAEVAKLAKRLEKLEAEKLSDSERAEAERQRQIEAIQRERDELKEQLGGIIAANLAIRRRSALQGAGAVGDVAVLDQVARMLPDEAQSDEDIAREVDLLKARTPGLFQAPPPTRPGSSPPGMAPTSPPADRSGAMAAILADETLSHAQRQRKVQEEYARRAAAGP